MMNNMEQRIKVWEATEHCGCNSCHAINYKTQLIPSIFEQVDRLLCIQVGNLVTTLCPACALKLVQLIAPEICESDEEYSEEEHDT